MNNNARPINYPVSFTPRGAAVKTDASFHDLTVARKFANAMNGQLLAPSEARRSYFAAKLWNALGMGEQLQNLDPTA